MDWGIVLAAAGAGSLVGAAFTTVGHWYALKIDRDARRKELLLTRSIELAKARREVELLRSERAGTQFEPRDDIFVAAEMYAKLRYLLDHGKLPPNAGREPLPAPFRGTAQQLAWDDETLEPTAVTRTPRTFES
jgi:hypothetical protein